MNNAELCPATRCQEFFARHGINTSPGEYSQVIEALPGDTASILRVVRGLLLHGDHLNLYDLDERNFKSISRETLPLEQRLKQIFRINDKQLTNARDFHHRAIGTCRDYALMTCGILRQKRIPARVRCGFARYFSSGKLEDHWICEIWQSSEGRWARADAQLDDKHCKYLGISFCTSELPAGAFLTAAEAWHLCRSNGEDPGLFGHGDFRGEWFLRINLARDCLALTGQEISIWDNWRIIAGQDPRLSENDREHCDEIADLIEILEKKPDAVAPGLPIKPFWLL